MAIAVRTNGVADVPVGVFKLSLSEGKPAKSAA
jgi:hypothetical protein